MNSPTPSDLRDWLRGVIATCYAARSTLNPWQYAELKVYLSALAAAEPGMYRSSFTIYTRRLQELGAAPAIDPMTGYFVHTYVCMKASRTGFTEAALNIIRWMPENQPGHVLYVIDSKDEVKAISKERLKPTIEAILGEANLPDDPDDMGTFKMFLRNMTILLSGSYSEGVFANKWLRKAILDECEVLSQLVGGSTPIDLVDSRGTTVDDFQKFLLSKPKLPLTRFHQEYLDGTQEKFFVPCPLCGHFQELVWDNVRFDHCKELDGRWNKKRIPLETYYQCVGNGCRIDPDRKNDMVKLGEWRITNPDFTPGKVSQQISDLYSPFEKVSWGNLALIWLSSQDSFIKIQHFINNHLGLPYEAKKVSLTTSDLLRCRSGQLDPVTNQLDGVYYRFGELPWVPHLMLGTSDVQDDVVKWNMWAFRGIVSHFGTPDQTVRIETALIDYGTGLGFPDLAALLDKGYYVRGGDGTPCFARQGLVDSGWSTFETYDFCIEDGRWFPTKGASAATSGQLVVMKEREHNGRDFIRYDYEDHSIKIEFYEGRIKRRRWPRLYFPSDFGDEKHAALRAELTSEKQVVDSEGGISRLKWKKTSGVPNDWGDAGKAMVVGLTILLPEIEEMATADASEKAENSNTAITA